MTYPVIELFAAAFMAYAAAILAGALLARRGFPVRLEQHRIGCVDGLRGFLAISVLIYHFIIWLKVSRLDGLWESPNILIFNGLGPRAVGLFFMTTGLVFYPVILKGFSANSWRSIYVRRVFRILPLVVVSVVFVSIIIALRTGRSPDSGFLWAAIKWISTWDEPPLMGYSDSGRINAFVLWSLWYEWLFYLFVLSGCALAIDVIRGRLPTWTLPIAIMVGAVFAKLANFHFGVIPYLPLFAMGMLAYECQSRENVARWFRTRSATCLGLLALGLGLLFYIPPYNLTMLPLGVFFACVACGNSMGGVLSTKGALVLGESSYNIYLLHGIIISMLFVDLASVPQVFSTVQLPMLLPFVAFIVVCLTALTFLSIERPAMRIGIRLISNH
jgi:peptidoglycan/LPS O-acetylase OafA/YrhL